MTDFMVRSRLVERIVALTLNLEMATSEALFVLRRNLWQKTVTQLQAAVAVRTRPGA